MQQGSGYGQYPQGPYMGPPPKKPMSTGLILLIVFGTLLGTCMTCGVISAASKKDSATTTATATTATTSQQSTSPKAADKPTGTAAPTAPPITVTSLQLWNDYQANEIAADAKYKGKRMLVAGTVTSIDKGPFGGLLLRLATGNQFMQTTARMDDSQESQLAQLSRGQQVHVLCTCQGIVIKSPQLDDCIIQ